MERIYTFVESLQQPLPPARPSQDTSLTAFAHLGLLRLNAQRSFVSLFDQDYEYIIAETCANSSLQAGPTTSESEGLILCGIAVPRAYGLCDHVVQSASDDLHPAEQPRQTPVVIVPDLQADSELRTSRLVTTNDDLRFFAAVPIRSTAGLVIGVYAVIDCEPRSSLTDFESDFLRNMSLTMTNHLDLHRSKRELRRSKRMVRGLGSFVEGKSTMSGLDIEPLQPSTSDKFVKDFGSAPLEAQNHLLRSEEVSVYQQRRASLAPQFMYSYFPPVAPAILARPMPEDSISNLNEFGLPSRRSSNTRSSGKGSRTGSIGSSSGARIHTSAESPLSHGNKTSTPGSSSTDIEQLFSRAANIIRESVEVDGVLFFDASIGSYGGLTQTSEGSSIAGDSLGSHTSSGEDTQSPINAAADEKYCDVFGFSMSDASSLNNESSPIVHGAVPELFLRILLRRYPEGKIFSFEQNGLLMSDADNDGAPKHKDIRAAMMAGGADKPPNLRRKTSTPYSRENEGVVISRLLPYAKSVITLPLWDSHRERWFAAGMAWTKDPTRVFSVPGELSYLRAFGMVIMAEIARMDSEKSEKAKNDVLGSISHELRSPLHGILGGAEILQGTELDAFQGSVVDTVETCSMTLLDTIDHLLDYAKINHFIHRPKVMENEQGDRRQVLVRAPGSYSISSGMMYLSSDIEVDAIVEEVIESVYAGYAFQDAATNRRSSGVLGIPLPNVHIRSLDPDRLGPDGYGTPTAAIQEKVNIILDIELAESWTFNCETGALRRIVMNLFGNSLKYTESGHISVTVKQTNLSSSKRRKKRAELSIVVQDTGRGMSREFMTNHLFRPFSQEDPLSPGTGLGLSIILQIIKGMGGTITAESHIGKGTTMTVHLPLTRSSGHATSGDTGAFLAQAERTSGLRVHLYGFGSEDDGHPGTTDVHANADLPLPKKAIEHLCTEWLHMQVLGDEDVATTTPEIYIATQQGAAKLIEGSKTRFLPVVVLCPSASAAHSLSTSSKTVVKNGVFEYISQP